MNDKRGRVVYVSGPGGGSGTAKGAEPPQITARAPASHDLRVRRERAGRGGKTVTTVAPLELDRAAAAELLGRLKRVCGCGGTLRDGTTPKGSPCLVLEVQGDHVDRVVAELAAAGFRAKPGQ